MLGKWLSEFFVTRMALRIRADPLAALAVAMLRKQAFLFPIAELPQARHQPHLSLGTSISFFSALGQTNCAAAEENAFTCRALSAAIFFLGFVVS
uniref:Uncharacterized protein n=1 Tax=Arundo donax TaxID=35708 RepID=A0A0A9TVD1_ARUDO